MKVRAQNITIHHTLFRLFLLAMLFTAFFHLGGLVGCGASGLLPQTSLPLPENDDPITISSPDAAGYVVITGSDEAVPEDSTIIVTVTAASSNLNIDGIGKSLFRAAYAGSCASELPECPELSGDNQCQFTANDDGSFTLSVPASLSSTIAVNYLDPTTCEEVVAYEEIVEEGVTSIDLDVVAVHFEESVERLYLFGIDAEADAFLRILDPAIGSETDIDLGTTDSPHDMVFFTDHRDSRMVVLTFENKLMYGPITSDGSIDLSEFVTLVDPYGNALADVDFLMARPVQRDTTADTCVGASLFEIGDTDRFTRLVFSMSNQLYLLEYEDDHTDVDPSYIHTSHQLMPRNISFNVDDLIAAVPQLAGLMLTDVMSMQDIDGQTYMLAVLTGNAGLHFELLRFSPLNEFCQSQITFDTTTDEHLYLGSSAEVSFETFIAFDDDGTGETEMMFMLHKVEEAVVLVVDMQAETMSCISDAGVLYLPGSSDVADNSSCVSDTTVQLDLMGLDVSNVVVIEPVFSEATHGELFFLGKDNGGMDFYPRSGDSVFESEDEKLFVINPIAGGYIADTNQMVVIDQGFKGDGYSNMLFYDLGATPILW